MIYLYVKDNCIACTKVKKVLNKNNIEYMTFFMSNRINRETLKRKGYTTVPVLYNKKTNTWYSDSSRIIKEITDNVQLFK